MRSNLSGCAVIVLGISVVGAALTVFNQTAENEQRQRLGRMRTVRAVIIDKGIATYESRDTTPGKRGQVVKEKRYWIRFECQVGGAIQEGNRLSLFPLDEKTLWERFEKGGQYDAHYDPELRECILVVDEPPGGLSRARMGTLLACAITAAAAVIVLVATRRRGAMRG